jgi:hypothetical protein
VSAAWAASQIRQIRAWHHAAPRSFIIATGAHTDLLLYRGSGDARTNLTGCETGLPDAVDAISPEVQECT